MNFRIPYLNIISGAPDLIMGIAFLATWIEPNALGENMFQYFMLIMLLEFITIHSSAFMGWAIFSGKTRWQKTYRVIALGVFYSLFLIGFSATFGTLWPLGAFWLLVLNRLFSVLFGGGEDESKQAIMMSTWAANVFFYVISVFIGIWLPLPRLGWTAEFVATLPKSGSGLWFDEPHSLLAAGFLYFTAMGIIELFYMEKIARQAKQNSESMYLSMKK